MNSGLSIGCGNITAAMLTAMSETLAVSPMPPHRAPVRAVVIRGDGGKRERCRNCALKQNDRVRKRSNNRMQLSRRVIFPQPASVAARQITIRVYGNTAVGAAYVSGTDRLPGGQQLHAPWRYTEARIRDVGTWKSLNGISRSWARSFDFHLPRPSNELRSCGALDGEL